MVRGDDWQPIRDDGRMEQLWELMQQLAILGAWRPRSNLSEDEGGIRKL